MLRSLRNLLLSAVTSVAAAQVPRSVDLYSNFVGEWVGTDQYVKAGNQLTESISVRITEKSKASELLLEYTVPDGANRDRHVKRVLSLDPVRQRMTSQWAGADRDVWETKRLDEFATTGLGSFAVTKRCIEEGKPVVYWGEFSLTRTEFTYAWQRSESGQPFLPVGLFKLHRAFAVSTP